MCACLKNVGDSNLISTRPWQSSYHSYRRNLWTLVNALNDPTLPQAQQAYNDAIIIGFNIGLGPLAYANSTLTKTASFVSDVMVAPGPYRWSWHFSA